MNCQRQGCTNKIVGRFFPADILDKTMPNHNNPEFQSFKRKEKWCEHCAVKLEPNKYILCYYVCKDEKKIKMERYKKKFPDNTRNSKIDMELTAPVAGEAPKDYVEEKQVTEKEKVSDLMKQIENLKAQVMGASSQDFEPIAIPVPEEEFPPGDVKVGLKNMEFATIPESDAPIPDFTDK